MEPRKEISDLPKVRPLCAFFLSSYLSQRQDALNFPVDEIQAVLDRYEKLFSSALVALQLSKEALQRREEFNFSSGNAQNFESAIATLRTAIALHDEGFKNVSFIQKPKIGMSADLTCEKDDQRYCVEVKAITKSSDARHKEFFETAVFEKMRESAARARQQLEASAAALRCSRKVIAFVLNWFEHSIVLDNSDFGSIVNQLEQEECNSLLNDIHGIFILTQQGVKHYFTKT